MERPLSERVIITAMGDAVRWKGAEGNDQPVGADERECTMRSR
jgi:hypothetical protein